MTEETSHPEDIPERLRIRCGAPDPPHSQSRFRAHTSAFANMRFLSIGAFSLIPLIVTAYPDPGSVTGDTAVHDPTICKDDSGTYFVYSTGAGIEIRTSTDRTAWTYQGVVFDDPSWTDEYTGTSNGCVFWDGSECGSWVLNVIYCRSLWAPDCTYTDGTFYVRFVFASTCSFNLTGRCIVILRRFDVRLAGR